jgi:hypothetical protein
MSIRPLAVCAILICAAGCYKQEQANAVQHPSAWQRQAGESTVAAANVFKRSESNSEQLNKAIQSGKAEDLQAMQGKLVRMDGELADKNDSSWTIKKDGWTIVAQVNDLTPHADCDKSEVSKCGAQGIIQSIDQQNKTIVLADVELAPEMKGQFSEHVASK